MPARKLSALIVVAVAMLALGFACGGNSDDVETGDQNGAEPTIGPQLLAQPTPAQDIDSEPTRPSGGVVDIVIADLRF
ncbi:MAG: hypothetical protein ACE5FA_13430, partial [Dehalococcoidia bacterium]